MSKNCLVSKLKGVIDNDGLQTLGKVKIILNPSDNARYIFIRGNNCKMSFVDCTFNGRVTITLVGDDAGYIVYSGNNPYIIADAYSLETFSYSSKTVIEGLDSMSFGITKGLFNVSFNNVSDLSIFKNLKALSINDDYYTIKTLLTYNHNLITVGLEAVIHSTMGVDISNIVSIRYNGDVGDLSLKVVEIYCSGIYPTGSITKLVDKFRNNNRTSGKITLKWAAGASNDLTIEDNDSEISVAKYCQNRGYNQESLYLTWDTNSLSITNDRTGVEDVPTVVNYLNFN